jgi:hypothetical protein
MVLTWPLTRGTCLHTKEQHSGRNKQTGYGVCQRKMAYLPNTAGQCRLTLSKPVLKATVV